MCRVSQLNFITIVSKCFWLITFLVFSDPILVSNEDWKMYYWHFVLLLIKFHLLIPQGRMFFTVFPQRKVFNQLSSNHELCLFLGLLWENCVCVCVLVANIFAAAFFPDLFL